MATQTRLTTPTTAPTSHAPPPRSLTWRALRPLVMRVHFYAGVLVAPLLLVAAVTGLLYTASPQLERIVHGDVLSVPAPSGPTAPLAEQVAAARAAHPEGTISAVRPAAEPGGTTRVVLADVPGLDADHGRTVFVDPQGARVVGAETTSGEWLPVRAWLDELHRTLHAGDVGRLYSETAASWLWVVVLGGLALWIGKLRVRRKLADVPGRPRLARRHALLGGVLAFGLLGLSATGLTWSHYAGDNVSQLRADLSMSTPALAAGVEGDAAAGHEGHAGHDTGGGAQGVVASGVGPDRIMAAAVGAGLQLPMELTPPAEAGDRWLVSEVKRSWPVRQDSVAVDGATGRAVDELRFADWPLAGKLAEWGVDAHMGLLLGLANQLVLAAVAIGLLVLIAWGYRMWWLRRPTKSVARSVGRPPARGASRRVPLPVLLPAIAVTALVGWFLPLLGITLVAFLLLDVLLGLRRRPGYRRLG